MRSLPCRRGVAAFIDRRIDGSVKASIARANEFIVLTISVSDISKRTGAAQRFYQRHSELGALVLENTNLSPFAADIEALLGLPVFDTVWLINWFHSGLPPRRF